MKALSKSALVSIVAIACSMAIVVTGQQPETLTVTPVKDGLYYINGVGGNVGVRVTADGVILIDDKYPRNVEQIKDRVRDVTSQPIRYIINTHHHGDHAGGNAGFIDTAEVIAHENARKNMVRGEQDAPPRLVYSDQTAVHLGGVEVRAYHLGRGHTNGDSVVYFPDLKTIHCGDLLHGIAPFIDYANGGSSKEWISTLEKILELDFDTAIPGHGSVMARSDIEAFREQFLSVRERMQGLIESGLEKDDAAERIVSDALSWTLVPDGLFMRRSIPGFYDEIAAEIEAEGSGAL